MKLLVKITLVLIGLAGLRFLVPFGLALAHYDSAPRFRDWVRAHPVEESLWRASAPRGVALGDELPWRSSDEPGAERHGHWRPSVRIEHGADVLLDLELDVSVESRGKPLSELDGLELMHSLEGEDSSELFESLSIATARAEVDADFHAVAVLTTLDFFDADAQRRWQRPSPGPEIQLDVFVLSGPGPLQTIVQDAGATPEPMLGDVEFDGARLGWHEVLLGIAHPTDPAPEEGLGYHARVRFRPNWTELPDGSSTQGFTGKWEFSGTSEQYTVRFECAEGVRAPFVEGKDSKVTSTRTFERYFTHDGETW